MAKTMGNEQNEGEGDIEHIEGSQIEEISPEETQLKKMI